MKRTKGGAVEVKCAEVEKVEAPLSVSQLRECGVYQTPDGKKLVASRFRRRLGNGERIVSGLGSNSSYLMFSQYHWAFHGEPAYEVSPTGELFTKEGDKALTVDQLTDTGVTAGSHW